MLDAKRCFNEENQDINAMTQAQSLYQEIQGLRNDLTTIKNEKEVKKYYPHGFHKVDKLGHPIYIERLSDINFSEIFKVTDEKELTLHLIKESEREVNLIYPNHFDPHFYCILDLIGCY